jgi:phage baseplate assembly protein V
MLRFGKITEIDVPKCYARVTFTDDGIVSAPLQILVQGAADNKYYHIFDINQQVAVLMDEESVEGVILGAVYNEGVQPDGADKDVVRVKFSDNSSIEYNRSTHELNVDVQGVVNVSANAVNIEGAGISLTGPVTITGNVTTIGNITATGNVSAANVTASAAISAPSIGGPGVTMSGGNLEATGEVKAATITDGTIDLAGHKHSGVTTGGGTSGPSVP